MTFITKYAKALIVIALFVAFAGYTAAVFRAGGAGPRAELKSVKAQVDAAHTAFIKRDAQREKQHQQLIGGKNEERLQAIASNNALWRDYIAGLPKPTSGTSKDSKPIPIAAEGLNDAADRERVSAAVSRFRDEVREAAREFRDEVAGQLEHAQLQTDALIRAQVWVVEEQKINQ